MFKSPTETHRAINHMIIFNDSISKFYQCSIWGFSVWGSLRFMFFSIWLGKKKKKKYSEAIEFLRIFKKYVSDNEIYFCSRKNLVKKLFFLSHNFKLDFITQIIYCIIPRCLCSHFVLICQSLRNGLSVCDHFVKLALKGLTNPYSCNWQMLTKWIKKEARSIRVWTLNM